MTKENRLLLQALKKILDNKTLTIREYQACFEEAKKDEQALQELFEYIKKRPLPE